LSAIPQADGDTIEEADRLEQHACMLGDDEDDYPHERLGVGWP